MDILIVKLGALGDVINTLPLAICLKTHLKARIHWLVQPLSYPILVRHPYIDRVLVFNQHNWKASLKKVICRLRSQQFDITLDLQRLLKSGFFSLSAKSKRRIGFDSSRCKEMSWLYPFERIPPSNPNSHMLLQYLEFANYLGLHTCDVRWEIPITNDTGFKTLQDYVVLNIGATKPANRWSAKGFACLAMAVKKQFNLLSVLTGGKEDISLSKTIMADCGQEALNLVGKTSLEQLIEIMNKAKIVVTCDTGPMHLAVALGKEVVALFGPSDSRRTGPFRGKVIQKDVDCSPCNQRNCDNPVCMNAITDEDVIQKMEEILI